MNVVTSPVQDGLGHSIDGCELGNKDGCGDGSVVGEDDGCVVGNGVGDEDG